MSGPSSRDFRLGRIACRWGPQPPDALPVARDWLRAVAGPDAAASLARGAHGRPRLAPGCGDIGWSHAGGRLLLAHAPEGRVGVDVERSDRRVDALGIARRHFSAPEYEALQALPTEARLTAFLAWWCAREAVLKAHGRGIAFGLSRVAFVPDPSRLTMLACDPALGQPRDWTLERLEPEPGYLAVLAWHDGILHR